MIWSKEVVLDLKALVTASEVSNSPMVERNGDLEKIYLIEKVWEWWENTENEFWEWILSEATYLWVEEF